MGIKEKGKANNTEIVWEFENAEIVGHFMDLNINPGCRLTYYHLRSTVKREHFFAHGDSFPDNCIDWTNENVSFGARNYECLLSKRNTFCSRGEQV